jgi:hypothetical protein
MKGESGFIDLKGNMVIPLQADTLGDFVNGIAVVFKNGRYGLMDKKGNEAAPCIWNEMHPLKKLLQVECNGKMAYYNMATKKYVWTEEGFGK